MTVSKTTFENYSCDKDVASKLRPAPGPQLPGGRSSTTTVQKTFTLTAADVVFSINGTSFNFSFNAPASGPVISAHFYWADREVNAGKISWWGVSQTMVGKNLTGKCRVRQVRRCQKVVFFTRGYLYQYRVYQREQGPLRKAYPGTDSGFSVRCFRLQTASR